MAKTDDGSAFKDVFTRCPATWTVKVIGGRWKMIILFYLNQGTQRYSDLQRCLPEVTPKMLTHQLRELEEDGIVHREIYRQVPPRVEYSLTPLGESLWPILHMINEWGRENGPDLGAGRQQEGAEAGKSG